MLLTLTTPLARLVRGRWTSGSLFYWVLPLLEGTGLVDWILTAWVQVYFLKNSQVWHRVCGKFVILSFI